MPTTTTYREQEIVPNTSYPKGFLKNDTGETFYQPHQAANIFNTETGQEISNAALSSGFTELPEMTMVISNPATLEFVD